MWYSRAFAVVKTGWHHRIVVVRADCTRGTGDRWDQRSLPFPIMNKTGFTTMRRFGKVHVLRRIVFARIRTHHHTHVPAAVQEYKLPVYDCWQRVVSRRIARHSAPKSIWSTSSSTCKVCTWYSKRDKSTLQVLLVDIYFSTLWEIFCVERSEHKVPHLVRVRSTAGIWRARRPSFSWSTATVSTMCCILICTSVPYGSITANERTCLFVFLSFLNTFRVQWSCWRGNYIHRRL